MKLGFLAISFWCLAAGTALAQVPGPERELTAPETVQSPQAAAAAPVALSDIFRAAQSESVAWSADGRQIYFTSDQGGQLAIWRKPADGTGEAAQVGPADRRQYGVKTTDDGRWILFHSDIGGRQVNDIFAIPAAGGAAVNLTGTPDVDESVIVPSPDSRFVVVARRTKRQSSNNLAILGLDDRAVRTLTDEKTDGVQWWPAAVSHDGRFVLANRFDWGQEIGEAWIVEVATRTARRLSPEGVYAEAGTLSPDGNWASVTLEDERGILQAALVDLATGKAKALPASAWDQKGGQFSADGRKLVVSRNVDGRDTILLYDLRSGAFEPLDLPVGVNSRSYHGPGTPLFSPTGGKLLFPHTSGSEPLEYWVRDLAQGRSVQVTSMARIGDAKLPPTQLVRYRSGDGTIVSAYLWMPFNLKRDGTAPAIVRPHGGPTGQVSDTFDRTAAALASRGYLVLAPNFRGSTGYGREFLEANRKDLGGGDLDDITAGVRFMTETGFVDPKRVGITGGSYGGYMTLMALAKEPEVFRAGVNMFGIVNWRTMWEHGTLANKRYQRTLVGDPDADPESYDRASPLTFIDGIRAPLLVLHGENDPIVPIVEAKQVVELLDKPGQIVASRFYAEEGHGFGKRENQIDSLERLVSWFDTYLKRDKATGEP